MLAIGAVLLVRIETMASHNAVLDLAVGVTTLRTACFLLLPIVSFGVYTGIQDFRSHQGSRVQNAIGAIVGMGLLIGTLYLLSVFLTYPL